jgi:hypothetical protein
MVRPPLLILSLFIGCVIMFDFNETLAKDEGESPDVILDSAEKFFLSLQYGEYDTVWNLLSEKSHNTIINDVYKSSRKVNEDVRREDIIHNFQRRGVMFHNYWNGFRSTLNTKTILEQSLWEIGFIDDTEAEIVITYKKSKNPTRLKMMKEKKLWRIGLVETFWTGKAMKLLRFIAR